MPEMPLIGHELAEFVNILSIPFTVDQMSWNKNLQLVRKLKHCQDQIAENRKQLTTSLTSSWD